MDNQKFIPPAGFEPMTSLTQEVYLLDAYKCLPENFDSWSAVLATFSYSKQRFYGEFWLHMFNVLLNHLWNNYSV